MGMALLAGDTPVGIWLCNLGGGHRIALDCLTPLKNAQRHPGNLNRVNLAHLFNQRHNQGSQFRYLASVGQLLQMMSCYTRSLLPLQEGNISVSTHFFPLHLACNTSANKYRF